MSATWDAGINAFVLGHGTCNNPASERINGLYRFVGLIDDDDEWVNIMPCRRRPWVTENPWLETVGPGRLVFIPDSSPRKDGA